MLSPTFVLIQEHHGRRTIYHIDAYRLRDQAEFQALGAEEYFEGDGLVLVEWADRVQGCLPADRIEVRIEVTGPESRRFESFPGAQNMPRRFGNCSDVFRDPLSSRRRPLNDKGITAMSPFRLPPFRLPPL